MEDKLPTGSLINTNLEVLEQILQLVEMLSDEQYTHAEPPLYKSGIGGHIRHCIDWYECFLRGVHNGEIDYDHRERSLVVEQERTVAIDRIASIIKRLEGISDYPEVFRLEVKHDATPWTLSSIGRELQALLSHTTHHFALIVLMARLQGAVLPADFGVARSTLKYWKTNERREAECVR
ncbi:MAG TPA: DinB family protein [Blastocatellia bacterium]|nr:DinB family protein [Blastocatellia bacterium]